MKVIPLTIRRANEVVAQWHRHNKPVCGGKWALGAEEAGELVGVVIVGRPIARKLDNSYTVEVTRLCSLPTSPANTCSFLYGAARRVWFAMGGTKVVTYTLQSETGASLRGADFIVANTAAGGRSWNVPSRPRETQAVSLQMKIRWESNAA